MTYGRLITVEGIDGSGKTTLVSKIVDALSSTSGLSVKALREPGGVEVSERIRGILKDPELQIGSRGEALLYAAARAELIEQAVKPLLEQGTWVLLDRYVDSSLAYQGVARGLGVAEVAAINAFATGAITPDRTLLLELEPAQARARSEARGEQVDRIEAEDERFFKLIADSYKQFAAADPERFRVLDATLEPDALADAALGALADLTD